MIFRLDRMLTECNPELSRKEAKSILKYEAVTVNGVICRDPDRKIDTETDVVERNGKPVRYIQNRYFLLHKPAGVLSAANDKKQKTVVGLIPDIAGADYYPVGRLDKDTEGLLLITNDGDLTHNLLSPKKHVEKSYLAVCSGIISDDACEPLRHGVDLGDFVSAPAKVCVVRHNSDTTVLGITITEGKFHQVKRMTEAIGSTVLQLKRLRMGGLCLPKDLAPGEYRELQKDILLQMLKEEFTQNEEQFYGSYL